MKQYTIDVIHVESRRAKPHTTQYDYILVHPVHFICSGVYLLFYHVCVAMVFQFSAEVTTDVSR